MRQLNNSFVQIPRNASRATIYYLYCNHINIAVGFWRRNNESVQHILNEYYIIKVFKIKISIYADMQQTRDETIWRYFNTISICQATVHINISHTTLTFIIVEGTVLFFIKKIFFIGKVVFCDSQFFTIFYVSTCNINILNNFCFCKMPIVMDI